MAASLSCTGWPFRRDAPSFWTLTSSWVISRLRSATCASYSVTSSPSNASMALWPSHCPSVTALRMVQALSFDTGIAPLLGVYFEAWKYENSKPDCLVSDGELQGPAGGLL